MISQFFVYGVIKIIDFLAVIILNGLSLVFPCITSLVEGRGYYHPHLSQ